MDNASIARVLAEIADLLEIKGENPFKIRAYRNAADAIASSAERIAGLDAAAARWPSPASARTSPAKIVEIATTGSSRYHEELLTEFPPTILDLLRLQGVGPKTVALLYRALGIGTLDDLEAAAREGRLRGLRGMGAKKEALILKALDERKRYAGRHLLADAADEARAARRLPAARGAPATDFVPVGSLRRGARPAATRHPGRRRRRRADGRTSSSYPLVERVLGTRRHQDRASCCAAASRPICGSSRRRAAAPRSSTSPARRRTTSPCAIGRSPRGLRLNEYGLFRMDDGAASPARPRRRSTRRSGSPRSRRNCARTAARSKRPHARQLPRLIDARGPPRRPARPHGRHRRPRHDRGDGRRRAGRGLSYLAITDHSRSLAMAAGSTSARRSRMPGGSARPAGGSTASRCSPASSATSCPTAASTSPTTASPSSIWSSPRSTRPSTRTKTQMTDRILRAIESPVVDIIGHPTGRLLLQREAYPGRTSSASSRRRPGSA